jgi:inosose dehydratase
MSTLPRREFMRTTAGAAGAVLLGRAGLADEVQTADDEYGGFTIGIASYSLRQHDLETAIRHIAELDLHWVEFFGGHYSAVTDPKRISGVAKLLEPHGIRMHAHWVGDLGADKNANRALFEFARQAGVPLLTGHPLPPSLPILDSLVQEFDVKVGIHNHGPDHLYDTVDDMLDAAAPWDERIGFCLDTGHCMRSGEDPAHAVRRLGGRLYGLHLKDHEWIGRDEPPQTILGEGALNLEELCQALREVEFEAPISIEYDIEVTLDTVRRGLDNFTRAAAATR